MIAERKQSAVAYAERDGRILVVWNRRFGGWVLPGGKVEPGEDVMLAMHRELREETGLRCNSWAPLYVGESSRDDRRVHVYTVHVVGEPRQMEDGAPVGWLRKTDLLRWSPFADFYERLFETVGIKL